MVSLRGCSAVALIDADTEEMVAKIGRTNLSAEEWQAAGKGDPPLTILDDPHGEFCGNHAAWMQPHEHLVLFDNGNSCVTDPRTGETFRPSDGPERFSRVVEYDLDLDNGEAVFVRHHSLHGEENREGRSSGHVDVLANGDWLIGWGRSWFDTDPDTAWAVDEAVTQADPDTGEEKFALRISQPNGNMLDVDGDGDTERFQIPVRPESLSPVALARDRLELEASFAAGRGHNAEFFTSARDRPTVVVRFNQPVVDFDETTASIMVSGGSLESVAPHVVAGEPAYSYLLTLAPDGEAAVMVSLVASQGCDGAGGVCTADGSTLSEVPSAHPVRHSGPPSIDADSLAFGANENSTAVGRLSATDGDTAASQLTWSLASEAPGPDDAEFALSGTGVLSLRGGKDFEEPDDADQDGTYEVMVQVSDGDSTVSELVKVTLADVDEAPVVSGRSVVSYNENNTVEVDFYLAADPEGEPVMWSLSGLDADDFEIAGGALTFKSTPDFEARGGSDGRGNTYAVTVEASDGDVLGSLAVRVSVNDVNEAPVVSGPPSVNVDEGKAAVGSFTVRDPENDLVEWLLSGPDADRFEIADGQLRFRSSPDFEQPAGSAGAGNAYAVTVEASDGDLTGDVGVTVRVVNVEEPGEVSLLSVQPQAGSPLEARATDPDTIVGSVAWVWERSTNRRTWSVISGADSAVYTPAVADVGMWLKATASYDDGYAPSKFASAVSTNTVGAAPVTNRRPMFPATETGQRSVAENTPARRSIGMAVAATDLDAGDRLTYTLAGAGAASLDLDAGTGQLRTKTPLDHEANASLSVVVTATDLSGASATQTVTVTVEDVDEAPVPAGPGVARYPENGTTQVAAYRADDPELRPVQWSLSGTDRDEFTIDAAGVLRFVAPPDYETDSLYQVVVVATDDGGNSGRLNVNVTVTDENEAPAVRGDATPEFGHLRTGTVARYRAADPEQRPVQWSLSGLDSEDLRIDSGGVLRFVLPPDTDRPDDADLHNDYEVTVEASDGNSTGSLVVTVTVTASVPPIRTVNPTTGGGRGGGGRGGGGRGNSEPSTAVVIMANGWSPPDIGVAAALSARMPNSAVIYTAADRLSSAARDLLIEILPAEVIVVGGEGAIGDIAFRSARSASESDSVQRIAGATRAATAAAVARQILNSSPASGRTVIVANGWSPADIGVASALSARTPRSAVVYSAPDSLPAATRQLLRDYKPDRIVIIGGIAAVHPDTDSEIRATVPRANVERVSGQTRTSTAAAVARRFLGPPQSAVSGGLTIIVANGWSPPDVGLAAALSARTAGSAVLYTEGAQLSADVDAVLREYKPDRIVFIGGHAAISSETQQQARHAAPDAAIPRYSGATRTHTAAAVARRVLGSR